jgi:hypothetical protein
LKYVYMSVARTSQSDIEFLTPWRQSHYVGKRRGKWYR